MPHTWRTVQRCILESSQTNKVAFFVAVLSQKCNWLDIPHSSARRHCRGRLLICLPQTAEASFQLQPRIKIHFYCLIVQSGYAAIKRNDYSHQYKSWKQPPSPKQKENKTLGVYREKLDHMEIVAVMAVWINTYPLMGFLCPAWSQRFTVSPAFGNVNI